jgi:hypothetical protein
MNARQLYELAKLFVRRHYPLALVVVLYLLIYFGYRAIQPQSPRGLEVSGSLWVIAKTTYLFSIYGLHIEINPLANYLSSSISALQLVASVIYGVCISVIVFVLIPKIRGKVHPRTLSSGVGISVLLFFVFCPSVLLALTDGYQKWAAFDPHYVGSYFSSFPLALLASMLILYLVGGEKSRYEKILFAGVIYLIFSSAVDNNMRWAQLATENRAGSQLWRSAVAQLRSQGISQLSAATVCAHRGSPLKVKGDDVYWGRYLSEVLGTRVTYVAKPLPNQHCTHRLDFDALKHR